MNNKRIGVVTTTRAEYSLLKNVMKNIVNDEELDLILFVTGTHLLNEYGYTIEEIENDGFFVNEKIDILMKNDSAAGISKTMGMASILFGDSFERQKIDILIVLGDRYELLPICQAAMVACIPIVHIAGGEATEGAIDEAVRHCITKMSYLHFPSCEQYRKKIIQLGENPDRVFNYGDVGVENILCQEYFSKEKLEQTLKLSLKRKYFSVTFHPVTLENDSVLRQINELLMAIEKLPQYDYIFTKSNADSGNYIINNRIDEFVSEHSNCTVFESLGAKRYLSLLNYSSGIIGNSSSGIVEAPSLKIPTINIGDRQKGRLKSKSIIDCEPVCDEIVNAIKKAVTEKFIRLNCDGSSPYSGGDTASKIVKKIKEFLIKDNIDLKKHFYEIDF